MTWNFISHNLKNIRFHRFLFRFTCIQNVIVGGRIYKLYTKFIDSCLFPILLHEMVSSGFPLFTKGITTMHLDRLGPNRENAPHCYSAEKKKRQTQRWIKLHNEEILDILLLM